MANITEDIKTGNFKPVYLIYGDEGYLREFNRKKLLKALVKEGDSLNFASFSGKDADINEIISLAQTLPFMAEKRVVLVKDSLFFKNACEELTEYLADPGSDTVLIFDEENVDKRGKNYKAVEKLGGTFEAAEMKEADLKNWISVYFARHGKKIREATAELLISRAGKDMEQLSSEINKLIDYAGDREIIENEDIDAICTRIPADVIFQMIDAMAYKRQREAVGLYYELLSAKQKPVGILSLIERQFRILLIVKEMSDKKYSQEEIAQAAKVRPFTIRNYRNQAAKYSRQTMKMILNECAQAEADAKSGKIDELLAVELLVIRYS